MPACLLLPRPSVRLPPRLRSLAASITENPFIFIPRRLMASFVLCPHRPPQGQRGGCEGRTDGRSDGRTPKSSLRRDINVGGDRRRGLGLCLHRHQTHAKLSFMEDRRAPPRPEAEAEAETFTFLGLACMATLATRRRGGATGKDQNVFVWSQYPRGLEQCRRRKGKRGGESRATYGRQKCLY